MPQVPTLAVANGVTHTPVHSGTAAGVIPSGGMANINGVAVESGGNEEGQSTFSLEGTSLTNGWARLGASYQAFVNEETCSTSSGSPGRWHTYPGTTR